MNHFHAMIISRSSTAQLPRLHFACARALTANASSPSDDLGGKNSKPHKPPKPNAKQPAGPKPVSMDDIVALCKRRGFIFSSNDIYNTVPGFFDYGPLGVELKNNIKRVWWREMVHKRCDMVGLDSAIVGSPQVWTASGHVQGFSDPMVDCRATNLRFRADQVFWAALHLESDGSEVCIVSAVESENTLQDLTAAAIKKAKSLNIKGPFKLPLEPKDLTECPDEQLYARIPSPANGEPGHLTLPRNFNLMFETQVGSVKDASSVAYLRPETAQGIFTNFMNVQRTSRMKIPFGIAQIGKAFRNEITPRNFIFRSREFEQMEIEYFVNPNETNNKSETDNSAAGSVIGWKRHFEDWISSSSQFLSLMGLPADKMHFHAHPADKLAHYAVACTDITFDFLFGRQEVSLPDERASI
jgi:glycyl-tRNA synthetase